MKALIQSAFFFLFLCIYYVLEVAIRILFCFIIRKKMKILIS